MGAMGPQMEHVEQEPIWSSFPLVATNLDRLQYPEYVDITGYFDTENIDQHTRHLHWTTNR